MILPALVTIYIKNYEDDTTLSSFVRIFYECQGMEHFLINFTSRLYFYPLIEIHLVNNVRHGRILFVVLLFLSTGSLIPFYEEN